MLEVQSAYGKEHVGVLGCRERGAVGVESVVHECNLNEAALSEEYDERVRGVAGHLSMKGRDEGRGLGCRES